MFVTLFLTTLSLAPTRSLTGTIAPKMAAGGDETCELTANGTLRCWGKDKEGFLGEVPTGTFIDVDVEDGLGCALRESGTPVCWGRDDYGQQGAIPVESFKDIRTDWSFACGLRADNSLRCWGSTLDDRSVAPAGLAGRRRARRPRPSAR